MGMLLVAGAGELGGRPPGGRVRSRSARRPEVPPEPAALAEFDELARAAQTHVAELTGLAASSPPRYASSAPREWVDLHLTALRPVLEALARNLGEAIQEQIQAGIDTGEIGSAEGSPQRRHAGPMLAPALLGVQAGR